MSVTVLDTKLVITVSLSQLARNNKNINTAKATTQLERSRHNETLTILKRWLRIAQSRDISHLIHSLGIG